MMGKAMNSEYCLMSPPSFFSSAYSAASSFKCSVTRVPRAIVSPSVSSASYASNTLDSILITLGSTGRQHLSQTIPHNSIQGFETPVYSAICHRM